MLGKSILSNGKQIYYIPVMSKTFNVWKGSLLSTSFFSLASFFVCFPVLFHISFLVFYTKIPQINIFITSSTSGPCQQPNLCDSSSKNIYFQKRLLTNQQSCPLLLPAHSSLSGNDSFQSQPLHANSDKHTWAWSLLSVLWFSNEFFSAETFYTNKPRVNVANKCYQYTWYLGLQHWALKK